MKKQYFVFILSSFLIMFPCLNYKIHVVKKDGSVEGSDALAYLPKGLELVKNKAFYEQLLKEQKLDYNSFSDISKVNDYGVTLVYLGRYEEAKKVFKSIEKRNPGYYSTAANLGTIYELLGKNDSAYYWIKKGYNINPASHDSSEWIHVNILKFKTNKIDTVLNGKKLIRTDFGVDSMPKTTLSAVKLNRLKRHIYYQLDERISFISPKDKIMAQLLFDLGNAVALTDDITSALAIYRLAYGYGFDSDLFRRRIKMFENIQQKGLAKLKRNRY